jgi:hypothetical protein
MGWRRHAWLLEAACVLFVVVPYVMAQQRGSDPAALLRADARQRSNWARTWLSSDDPLRFAWGAWLARQDRQRALIPLLIEKVGEYQPADEFSSQAGERDDRDALLVVLDALIGLNARVPVEQARKLYPEFPAQSIILLVRSRDDAQSALFDIFHEAKANWNWLAAGNVLIETRPPGFAALLLSRFTQHVTVSVFDSGHGGGFGGGASECGFSGRAPKAGWPSVGLYSLTQFPERMPELTATFLVGGETTVYYWRIEPGNYDNPPDFAGTCDDGNRDQYRAQYLNNLMQISFPRISLDPYRQVTIEWEDEHRYRQELIRAVEEQRAAFRRAVACLQGTVRVLTPAEAATLRSRLEIVIRDERADPSAPLPAVLENDETTVVRTAFSEPQY